MSGHGRALGGGVAFPCLHAGSPFFAHSRWISEYSRPHGAAHAPVYRRRFQVDSWRRAECALCGLGFAELRINGELVGDDVLSPPITRYDVHCEYVVYDVGGFLRRGENVVEVTLGNGLYNQVTSDVWGTEHAIWRGDPKFLLDLQLDGVSQVVSDLHWRVAHGPILANSFRAGEVYDARRALPSWRPGEEPASEVWQRVYPANSPGGELVRAVAPGCRVCACLSPVAHWPVGDGAVIYDFGENLAGNCEITVSGEGGAAIRLEHAERLTEARDLDNTHNGMYTYSPDFQTDSYTLCGGGRERWHPSFGYHGFQYVKVTVAGEACLHDIKARVIHTAFAEHGVVATDDETLDRLCALARRSFVSNFVHIPTDCPHREKMGWTGDAQLAVELGLWHYEVGASYRSWLRSMRDCQRADGQVPAIVPCGGFWQMGPVWDSALILIPYQIWRFSGETQAVVENYGAGCRLMRHWQELAPEGIFENGPGDWCHVEQARAVPVAVDGTAYFYRCALCLAEMASVAGHPEDGPAWLAVADHIRAAFRRAFCPGDGHCAGDEATALALALQFGLAPDSERPVMAARLNRRMLDRRCRADFGISGAKAVPRALAECGYFDTALEVLTQREYPGWGWWLGQGATALWETWDGGQSRNHVMFGDVGAWVWEYAGGIRPTTGAPGFRRFLVCPPATERLGRFSGRRKLPQGCIAWTWERHDADFAGTLTVPPNTLAEVVLRGASTPRLLGPGVHEFQW